MYTKIIAISGMTIPSASIGIYIWTSDSDSATSSYKKFNNLPKHLQKFFPFSKQKIQKDYDNFWIIRKDDVGDNEFKKAILSEKKDEDFSCTLYIDEWEENKKNNDRYALKAKVCHIFEVVAAGKKVTEDNGKCPTSLSRLMPVSFENMQNFEYKKNLPEVFLVAIKFQGDKSKFNKGDDEDWSRRIILYSTKEGNYLKDSMIFDIDSEDEKSTKIQECPNISM